MPDHVATVAFEPVQCEVVRALPFGLLVALPNGRQGVVRERELAWVPQNRAKWLDQFPPGTSVQAVVLREAGGTLELSLRYAQNDPWLDIHSTLALGQVVDGVVTGLRAYGAFIEIRPGLTGLLHKSALPGWVDQPIDEVLWVGDRVKALIESIDAQERRIGLSMQGLHTQRWPDEPRPPASAAKPAPLANGRARDLMMRQLAERLPRRIMIVDDDPSQREALGGWAQRAKQHVVLMECADAALRVLDEQSPDLIVMDVGMPGTDGIVAMRQIRQSHPHIRCVLMTDWSRAGERLAEIERLAEDGVTLLVKPVFPEDLLEVLLDLHKRPIAIQQSLPLTDLKQVTSGVTALRKTLVAGLRVVRKSIQASHAVLFSVDPSQQHVAIAAADGTLALNEQAVPDLIFSPVRDLASDGAGPLTISDVHLHQARVRYLLPLVPFCACIGAPVPVDGMVRYVLMCFYTSPFEIGEAHADVLRLGAFGLGATITQHDYFKRLEESQRFSLLGHLTRGLVHEINHQLAPILYSVEDIRDQHAAVLETLKHTRTLPIEEMSACESHITRLERSVQSLAQTTRIFGRVTVNGQREVLRLDEIVAEASALTHDMADRQHVEVHLHEPDRLMLVQSHAVNVLQAVLNVLINAIQHIQLTRPETGGQVHIRFAERRRLHDTAVQIIVEDDGSGVHRALTERIFELGFTTRQDEGSGQGLYIARRLLDALNGRLFLQETRVLWGSRFVIELPSGSLTFGDERGDS